MITSARKSVATHFSPEKMKQLTTTTPSPQGDLLFALVKKNCVPQLYFDLPNVDVADYRNNSRIGAGGTAARRRPFHKCKNDKFPSPVSVLLKVPSFKKVASEAKQILDSKSIVGISKRLPSRARGRCSRPTQCG